jgi:hypothetical protein
MTVQQTVRISCKHKRSLYVLSNNTDNSQVTDYYNRYHAILRNIMKGKKITKIR